MRKTTATGTETAPRKDSTVSALWSVDLLLPPAAWREVFLFVYSVVAVDSLYQTPKSVALILDCTVAIDHSYPLIQIPQQLYRNSFDHIFSHS